MARQSGFTSTDQLFQILRAAGAIDEYCQRVVIDLKVNNLPVIYTEAIGTERAMLALVAELWPPNFSQSNTTDVKDTEDK